MISPRPSTRKGNAGVGPSRATPLALVGAHEGLPVKKASGPRVGRVDGIPVVSLSVMYLYPRCGATTTLRLVGAGFHQAGTFTDPGWVIENYPGQGHVFFLCARCHEKETAARREPASSTVRPPLRARRGTGTIEPVSG